MSTTHTYICIYICMALFARTCHRCIAASCSPGASSISNATSNGMTAPSAIRRFSEGPTLASPSLSDAPASERRKAKAGREASKVRSRVTYWLGGRTTPHPLRYRYSINMGAYGSAGV